MFLVNRVNWGKLFRAILNQPEPDSLKDFNTFAELDAWYHLYNQIIMGPGNWCDDYSREARKLAEQDGYFLSGCLVYKGQVYGNTIFDESFYHIGNMAIVLHDETHGNTESCYYVDLQWNKLVWICPFYSGGEY